MQSGSIRFRLVAAPNNTPKRTAGAARLALAVLRHCAQTLMGDNR